MKKNMGAVMMIALMGLAGGLNAADFGNLAGQSASGLKAAFADGGIAAPEAVKGFIGNDPALTAPARPVEWVAIPGGKFYMGTDEPESWFDDAKPVHEVSVRTFEMSRAPVTVEQYAECFVKGRCSKPDTGPYCNWDKPGRQSHPMNCVTWHQAQEYAVFMGARLPSEAEFEYAATGGRNRKYPWGNELPGPELAVWNTNGTMAVCSKPKGNSAQGLCDMSGNVWQWVQDVYRDSYNGAPSDGSSVEDKGSRRVIRGGSFFNYFSRYLRADFRRNERSSERNANLGFRLAK